MSKSVISVCEVMAALLSIALMGMAGTKLALRFRRVVLGEETVLGDRNDGFASGRELACAFCAGVLSRVLVYLLAFVMMRLTIGGDGLFGTLRKLWFHWDTWHYVGIAQEGYTAIGDERLRLVFFPLYPLLMRAFSAFTGGNVFHAGLLVSLLFTGIASALVYDLSAMLGGRKTGALSVAYFLLSPMSVFLNCVYTEALFIALTLGAVCLLRRGKSWMAALCGAASALTRMPGVIIAGIFILNLIEKIAQRRAKARDILAGLGQVVLVASGLLIYWGINWAVTGDPLMYLVYQKDNWHQEAGAFWQSASMTMNYVLSDTISLDWFFGWVTQLVAMFAVYAMLAFAQHKLPFDLAAYGFVYVAVVLSPTWLLSGPRYLYAFCALPLLKTKLFKSDLIHGLLLGISLCLLLVYIYGYTIAVAVL